MLMRSRPGWGRWVGGGWVGGWVGDRKVEENEAVRMSYWNVYGWVGRGGKGGLNELLGTVGGWVGGWVGGGLTRTVGELHGVDDTCRPDDVTDVADSGARGSTEVEDLGEERWWVGGWVGGWVDEGCSTYTPTHSNTYSSAFEPPCSPLSTYLPTHPPTHPPTYLTPRPHPNVIHSPQNRRCQLTTERVPDTVLQLGRHSFRPWRSFHL